MASTIMANSTTLNFEPNKAIDLGVVASNPTNEILRPRLGPLNAISFKQCFLKYSLVISGAPGEGTAIIKLFAGTVLIVSASVSLDGNGTRAGNIPVDLSQVAGETALNVDCDVTVAGVDGVGAFNAYVVIETPVSVSGC